jgi:hypothetical protein
VTSPIRRVAGGLTVLEGIWLFYAYFTGPTVYVGAVICGPGCPVPPQIYLWLLLPLGVITLIVGLLGVWGASFAYLAATVLSATVLVVTGYTVFSLAGFAAYTSILNEAAVVAALAVVTMLANAFAIRAKTRLSEQANPMNLPVFG